MRILVANVGSSSYKCRLFDMPSERDLAGAEVERVGSSDALVSYRRSGALLLDRRVEPVPDHRHAVQRVLGLLTDAGTGVLESVERLDGVGFKAVQAGPRNGSVLLDADVIGSATSGATDPSTREASVQNALLWTFVAAARSMVA